MNLPKILDTATLDEIVDFINAKINLPILSEPQERIIFRAILMLLFQGLTMIEKKKPQE